MNRAGEITASSAIFLLSGQQEMDFSRLWASPGSPPCPEARSPPLPSADQRSASGAGWSPPSPSSPSEFEFHTLADIRDESPASPTFLSSFPAAAPYCSPQISSSSTDLMSAVILHRPAVTFKATEEIHLTASSREDQTFSYAAADQCNTEFEPTAGMRSLIRNSKSSIASLSSSSSWSATRSWAAKGDEENSSPLAKKTGASKSLRMWTFKDLLRRTVPSSKADANFIARTFEASNSSKRSSSKPASSNCLSPQSSNSSTIIDSKARTPHHSSTTSQGPAPSPSRSPLSHHVDHYRLQKAKSQELGKKTFLPYRQSLLGCLGGGTYSSDQLVW